MDSQAGVAECDRAVCVISAALVMTPGCAFADPVEELSLPDGIMAGFELCFDLLVHPVDSPDGKFGSVDFPGGRWRSDFVAPGRGA